MNVLVDGEQNRRQKQDKIHDAPGYREVKYSSASLCHTCIAHFLKHRYDHPVDYNHDLMLC
ncbi:hypothetical protein, partial [Endozoicomonas acroporae]|uniref:hypothetical protein n=1 Tax=Endozoicomonas acroporae TaxID=1701104 RepID=UPI003D7AF1DB